MDNPNRKIIKNLINTISKEKFSGSFLFSGPSGTGKEDAAAEVIQEINQTGYSLERLTEGFHPDIIFISPEIEKKKNKKRAKDISIEQMKPKLKQAEYFNYQAPKKFFVIKRAEKMTAGASNSLLKIMEEPPDNCVFFLITSFEDRILDTIYSRCGKINFPLLNNEKVTKILEDNFSSLSSEDALKIAEIAAGRYKVANYLTKNKAAIKEKEREVEVFKSAVKGGINKSFDISKKYSEDKEKLLEAMDDWIYYLYNFTRKSVLEDQDARIQKKVFEMTKELVKIKIAIETTNVNSRLALENYFVKFQ
ncbi:MAG: hypothetical protein R6V40_04550 [Candidatus Moraniibacteriota bacterium]